MQFFHWELTLCLKNDVILGFNGAKRLGRLNGLGNNAMSLGMEK